MNEQGNILKTEAMLETQEAKYYEMEARILARVLEMPDDFLGAIDRYMEETKTLDVSKFTKDDVYRHMAMTLSMERIRLLCTRIALSGIEANSGSANG